MKMKAIIVTVALFISLGINAQIKKYSTKSTQIIKQNTTLKLPLLKATKSQKLPEGADAKFNNSSKRLTQFDLTPGAYAKYPAAINVTLDASKIRTNKAYLAINGYYDGEKISIGRARRRSGEKLILDFKGVKGKTYRIRMLFHANFDDLSSSTRKLKTYVEVHGGSNQASFIIEKGENKIDFLVEPYRTGWTRMWLLHTNALSCCGKWADYEGNFEFTIDNILIRELED